MKSKKQVQDQISDETLYAFKAREILDLARALQCHADNLRSTKSMAAVIISGVDSGRLAGVETNLVNSIKATMLELQKALGHLEILISIPRVENNDSN